MSDAETNQDEASQTAAQKAYARAQEKIAAVLAEGGTFLDLNNDETHALETLPPEIRDLKTLEVLSLNNTQVSDLAPIQNLSALTDLSLTNTQVSDLAPIQNLSALTRLYLNNTQVSDLAPIQNLSALTELFLDNTQVSDLAPIQNLSALTRLYLTNTQVSDLAPIQNLSALTWLYLTNTQVSDLAPIQNLSALTWLSLNKTQVSDLAPLSGLAKLDDVYLGGSAVLDLRPLADLDKLGTSRAGGLVLSNTPATAADPTLARLADIKETKERVDQTRAYLKTLPPWPAPLPSPPYPKVTSPEATLPKARPSSLMTEFNGGQMVRRAPPKLPKADAFERAALGWDALKTYREAFGDSFNVHNYAPLPNYLGAFDKAMGDQFDPKSLIKIGMMGSRLVTLSRNEEFLASLPVGASSDMQTFAAQIDVFMNRFDDWLEYEAEGTRSRVTASELREMREIFEQWRDVVSQTEEIDPEVSAEYASEVEEGLGPEADNTTARALADSNRELIRNLAEKSIEELSSNQLVRDEAKRTAETWEKEFEKIRARLYGWVPWLLIKNETTLRRFADLNGMSWLNTVLDRVVGEEEE